ncbi:MAG: hypothetical protein AUH92_03080 [Acidobacteria bacterium 13_1_40CM_4_69_4]|nr:MAG: hypothetical protein AUH92_03080 [Acidobacteria bacterium 13_1_40CM_4_69_4]
MKPARAALLILLALAVRIPILVTRHDDYASGGITTALGLVARNLLEGRGLVETTGPAAVLGLYDQQQAEGRLIDIQDFPDPPDQPTKPLIQRMPGYPLFLAAVWKVTGGYRYFAAQVVQALLSALLPLLLYDAGRRLFGETAGLIAGAITALDMPMAWLSVVPLYDGWVLLLAGLIVWLLVRSDGRGHPVPDWAWLGLAAAVGVYFKSTFLIVPPVAAAALVPRIGPRRAAVRGAVALGIPLLALTPWVVRNERIFHRPIVTNTFFWATVWEGFGEIDNDFGAVLDDRATFVAVSAEHPGVTYASSKRRAPAPLSSSGSPCTGWSAVFFFPTTSGASPPPKTRGTATRSSAGAPAADRLPTPPQSRWRPPSNSCGGSGTPRCWVWRRSAYGADGVAGASSCRSWVLRRPFWRPPCSCTWRDVTCCRRPSSGRCSPSAVSERPAVSRLQVVAQRRRTRARRMQGRRRKLGIPQAARSLTPCKPGG